MTYLLLAAREDGIASVDSYPPIAKLVKLGLVTRRDRPLSQPVFHATDAGRAVLAARGYGGKA